MRSLVDSLASKTDTHKFRLEILSLVTGLHSCFSRVHLQKITKFDEKNPERKKKE